MTTRPSVLPSLASLWLRRQDPAGHVPRRALRAAERVGADPASPCALRALAWALVEEVYAALGWPLPASPELAACRSAATSARQTALAVAGRVVEALAAGGGRTAVGGELGLALAVLGRWDVLPARGAVLIPLEPGGDEVSATCMPLAPGVRWAAGGRLLEELASNAVAADLAGARVLVPRPEHAAVYLARPAADGDAAAAALLGVARERCLAAGTWEWAAELAARAGRGRALRDALRRWGLVQAGVVWSWREALARLATAGDARVW